jgi:peptidoglycan/LPS O-acetylase OafA/YrhL
VVTVYSAANLLGASSRDVPGELVQHDLIDRNLEARNLVSRRNPMSLTFRKSTISDARTAPATPALETRVSIHSLTGVRILAALWVLVSHLDKELFAWFPNLGWFGPVIRSGMLGVDVFFILSGFIISYNYATRFEGSLEPTGTGTASLTRREQRPAWLRMYGRFLWLRIARLYPVHALTLLAVLVMYVTAQTLAVKLNVESGYSPVDFVRNVFLVHAWFSYDFNWNGPSWSISAEWFAYLLFPLFAVLTARVKSKWQVPVTFALLVALPLVNSLDKTSPFLNVLHLLRIATEFLAGCFLYRLHTRGAGATKHWWILTPVSGVLIVVCAAVLQVLGATLFWVSPLLAVFVYGVAQQRGALASSLAGSRMIFWGQVSYSLYMTHSLVRTVLRKILPFEQFVGAPLSVRFGLLGLYAISFAAVAVLVFVLVEEPARHWLRKRTPV